MKRDDETRTIVGESQVSIAKSCLFRSLLVEVAARLAFFPHIKSNFTYKKMLKKRSCIVNTYCIFVNIFINVFSTTVCI